MTYIAGQSPEVLCDLIIKQIRDNISSALSAVRTDRSDARITTDLPVAYYISERVDPYRAPAVFVVFEDEDFQVDLKQSNYNNAKSKCNVTCVVEDKDSEVLTRKIYRYLAALRPVLTGASLTSANSKVKMNLVIERARFSPLYTPKPEKSTAGVFRKEVVLECSVYHWESF